MVSLEDVYRLVAGDDGDAAIDLVFDGIDRMLSDGKFEECDACLSVVDVGRLSSSLVRGFLVITAAARSCLPSRRGLYQRGYARVVELRGEDVARRILANLE